MVIIITNTLSDIYSISHQISLGLYCLYIDVWFHFITLLKVEIILTM